MIMNHQDKPMRVDRDLANLLGIGRELKNKTAFVKLIRSPTAFFIHRDSIDKNNNLFNGEKCDSLAKLDMKGKPSKWISHQIR